jgi:ADP-heptose:LPS heptosyltransferase
MNVDFQRKVDRIAGTVICRLFSLFSGKRQNRRQRLRPQNIMVILLSEMGSLVLARPMFDHLKKKYPPASTFVLVFKQNKEVLDILEVVPEKNILTVRNDRMNHLLIDSAKALRTMRKIGIDTVLDCELFSRISSIYSFLSGANIRVGFHPYTQEGLFRGDFINRPVLYNPYQHISHQFITLVEAIESDGRPTVKRQVGNDALGISTMTVSQDEIAVLSERLKKSFPQLQGKKVIFIYPGGGLLPVRAWPLSYFCKIAEDFIQNGYVVGIIGLEQDKEIAGKIVSYCRSTSGIDLTGYTRTVRELMVLFHLASLLITNDGGPGHFAAMTPIPTIILYGPETPALYGSLDDKSINLYSSLSCSPCLTAYNHRNSPCDGDNKCLKSIRPETVLRKAYEALRNQESSKKSAFS